MLLHGARSTHSREIPTSVELRSIELPDSDRTARLRDVMEICPGGLVKQKFTPDDHPEQWNQSFKMRLRIHMINEKHFERETGLKLGPKKKTFEQDQNTFIMSDQSRAFVQDRERSKGIPSVAEIFKHVSRAKGRTGASPDGSSTRRNFEEHIEGQREQSRSKWRIGKLARYLLSCHK